MGVDMLTLGVKHRLHANDPLLLCKELSEIHCVNIEVLYDLKFANLYQVKIFTLTNEEADKTATITIPSCSYMDDLYRETGDFKNIDWQSDQLKVEIEQAISKGDDYYEFVLGEDSFLIFMHHIDLPYLDFRHSYFSSYFMDDYIKINREEQKRNILTARKKVKDCCYKYGCDFALYYADTILASEFISDHRCETKNELMTYIFNKKYIDEKAEHDPDFGDVQTAKENDVLLNVSDSFLLNQKPIMEDKCLAVFLDDFKDLKKQKPMNKKLKDWTKIDLSKASIFDLTDDIDLIRESECCLEEEEFSMDDRERYEREFSRFYIVSSMLALAEICNEDKLYKAIEKANPDSIPTFNE